MFQLKLKAILFLGAAILNIGMGIFVYSKNRKSKLNLDLSLAALFSGLYSFAAAREYIYAIFHYASIEQIPHQWPYLFWPRFTYISPLIIAAWVMLLLHLKEKAGHTFNLKLISAILYCSAITIFFIALSTPLVLKEVVFIPAVYSFQEVVGSLNDFVRVYLFGLLIFGIIILIQLYLRSTGIKRLQIKYIGIGMAIYAIGGIIFGAVLPLLKINIFDEFVPILSVFFVGFTAYATIRYRLFEIDTVIHKTLLWLLSLLMLVLPIGLVVSLFKDKLLSLNKLSLVSLTSLVLLFFLYYYKRLKPRIDHLFRRRKYDYYTALAELPQKIGSHLDIHQLSTRLFKELKDLLYTRNLLFLVRPTDQEDFLFQASTGYDSLNNSQDRQTQEKTTKLSSNSSLIQQLNLRQMALEREQVEIDPQYQTIKEDVLTYLNQNTLELLIPIVIEDRVNALIGLGKKENLQGYTLKDIELLEHTGRQLGITIDNCLHHKDILEKQRLAEELRLGQEIQQNLLPKTIPQTKGLSLAGLMLPAQEIGGDYYDFIESKDRLAIVIADVSGKGVAAGLIMATAKATLKGLSLQDFSPKQILAKTNQLLFEYTNSQKFITLLYFQYEPKTKKLSYSSAGHEHILIYRANSQKIESILSGGIMLGMLPDIDTYLEEHTLSLSPQDKLILYTDGITEARNPSEEFFGLERLIQTIERHGKEPPEQLLSSIKNEVSSFMNQREQYDDITLVVAEGG